MSDYHKLYTPADSAVVFIDPQPQMTFGVANIDRAGLINNVTLLAKVAKEFQHGLCSLLRRSIPEAEFARQRRELLLGMGDLSLLKSSADCQQKRQQRCWQGAGSCSGSVRLRRPAQSSE